MSVNEKLLLENPTKTNALDGHKDCSARSSITEHPYLAFVHTSLPACRYFANNSGHIGKDFPVTRSKEHFVIMITGASVPHQLMQRQTHTFEQTFNGRYRINGKKIVVVNGSLEGWKMPQQLIMLMLYSNVIDAVISLDGYNELVFPKREGYHYKLDLPFIPAYQKSHPASLDIRVLVALQNNQDIYHQMETNLILSHSKTAYFLTSWLRKHNIAIAAGKKDSGAIDTLKKQFALPEQWSDLQRRNFIIEQYKNYVRSMKGITTSLNIKYSHFIQPVPMIEKKLSSDEKKRVTYTEYKEDYLYMTEQLLQLQKEHISVHSLTGLYIHHNETLYRDNIHQDIESIGYDILIDTIVDQAARDWGLDRRENRKSP